MFKTGTTVFVTLKARGSSASRDMTIGKEYKGAYIEPYSTYSINRIPRKSRQYAGVKIIDDAGDEAILCTNVNQDKLIISLVSTTSTENNTMNTNSKQQALKELEELKARAAALENILSEPESSEVYQGVFLEPNDKRHFFVSSGGAVESYSVTRSVDARLGVAYVDEATAKKALRHLELVQMYRKAAAEDWGDTKPKWNSGSGQKYVLELWRDLPHIESYIQICSNPYHFRTRLAAEDFKNSLSVEEFTLLIKGLDA